MLAFGQSTSTPSDTRHKNIYVELRGIHQSYGINFDIRFKKGQKDGLGLRLGLGKAEVMSFLYPSVIESDMFTLPIELNYIIGKGKSSLLAGFGILSVWGSVPRNDQHVWFQDFAQDRFGLLAGFLNFGYRFQPKKDKGLMFQLNWNPMFVKEVGLTHGMVGVGVGISLK